MIILPGFPVPKLKPALERLLITTQTVTVRKMGGMISEGIDRESRFPQKEIPVPLATPLLFRMAGS
jgi:hypothetical protein